MKILSATVFGALLILTVRLATAESCRGDCNCDGNVTVDELVVGVNIALGDPVEACYALDDNTNERVSIEEVVGGVRSALYGCVYRLEDYFPLGVGDTWASRRCDGLGNDCEFDLWTVATNDGVAQLQHNDDVVELRSNENGWTSHGLADSEDGCRFEHIPAAPFVEIPNFDAGMGTYDEICADAVEHSPESCREDRQTTECAQATFGGCENLELSDTLGRVIRDALQVELIVRDSDNPNGSTQVRWLAKGLGPVRTTEVNEQGGIELQEDLICAHVNGVEYGRGCAPGPERLVTAVYTDETVVSALASAGDGLSAKRAAIPLLYPDVKDLLQGGAEAAEAMLRWFAGRPPRNRDSHLFLFAYALEQMQYTAGIDRLTAFLERNLTGEVYITLSAVTHALRSMASQPLDNTAAYVASEMEDTIAHIRPAPSTGRGAVPGNERLSCQKEYILVDESGADLHYPPNHPNPNLADQPIKFSASVHSRNSVSEQRQRRVFDEVVQGGGVYVDGGTTFQGQPTNRVNCAGFVTRRANPQFSEMVPESGHWTSEPGRLYEALRAAGAITEKGPLTRTRVGDLVFYFRLGTDTPAHVAEVIDAGTLLMDQTVRNADGETGIFEAPIGADYFLGDQDDLIGPRYERFEIWQLKDDKLPPMRLNTDRDRMNSCTGEDDTGDGFPETLECGGSGGAGASTVPVFQVCVSPELQPPTADPDGDGIPNATDNCLIRFNPDQVDSDEDNIGNTCDDSPCPTYEVVTGPCGGPGMCIEGFFCSRQTIACEQETCPEGAGRTYTLECCCDCWTDKSLRNVYDPCRRGFLIRCAPRGDG